MKFTQKTAFLLALAALPSLAMNADSDTTLTPQARVATLAERACTKVTASQGDAPAHMTSVADLSAVDRAHLEDSLTVTAPVYWIDGLNDATGAVLLRLPERDQDQDLYLNCGMNTDGVPQDAFTVSTRIDQNPSILAGPFSPGFARVMGLQFRGLRPVPQELRRHTLIGTMFSNARYVGAPVIIPTVRRNIALHTMGRIITPGGYLTFEQGIVFEIDSNDAAEYSVATDGVNFRFVVPESIATMGRGGKQVRTALASSREDIDTAQDLFAELPGIIGSEIVRSLSKVSETVKSYGFDWVNATLTRVEADGDIIRLVLQTHFHREEGTREAKVLRSPGKNFFYGGGSVRFPHTPDTKGSEGA